MYQPRNGIINKCISEQIVNKNNYRVKFIFSCIQKSLMQGAEVTNDRYGHCIIGKDKGMQCFRDSCVCSCWLCIARNRTVFESIAVSVLQGIQVTWSGAAIMLLLAMHCQRLTCLQVHCRFHFAGYLYDLVWSCLFEPGGLSREYQVKSSRSQSLRFYQQSIVQW